MHKQRPAIITSPIISLNKAYVRMIPLGLIIGAAGIGASFLFSAGDFSRFSFSWLTSFCALLSMSLGCLFFVIIQHLTRAGWSATVRRIAEIFAMCTLPMFVLFLPILLPVLMGKGWVYEWNVPGWSGEAASPMEKLKEYYLVDWFFAIRIVAVFAIWGAMAWFFLGNSLKQDRTGDPQISKTMQKHSTWIMIVFAATLVFSSFDLEMSLAPLWFSTMFPVYFFAGSFLSGMAVLILASLLLQRSGRITDEITIDNYHDMAKLAFSFVFFWGYIAFSQFMLIWYANLPEETFWYGYRINMDPETGSRGWQMMSLALLFGHLLIPFLGIMARTVRRNKTYLFFASIWLLFFHWIDHLWIIMPESTPEHTFNFSLLIDIPMAIGMIGIYMALFALIAGDRPLIAKCDPRLGEALNLKNH